MASAFSCFSAVYDAKLLALAVIFCMASSFAVFNLLSRVIAEQGGATASTLLTLATIVAAADIWTTHFICMVAYHPTVNFGVSARVTAISLLLLLVVVGMAFTFIVRSDRPINVAAAGGFVGLAMIIMHYADVRGSFLGEFIVWNRPRIAASAIVALLFATGAMMAFGRGESAARRVGASVCLGVGIISTHFTAMSALDLLPGSAEFLPKDFLSGSLLGYAAALASVLVITSGWAAFFLDFQSRRESERRFKYLARHDLLTGLPNRFSFQERVELELQQVAKDKRSMALICLDLDGFKEVNDIFGHGTGDSVLVEVAQRLKGILGERCVAARLGGDEFAILVTDLDLTKTALSAAQTALDALKRSFVIDEALIDIGCSIGLALCPEDGMSCRVLLGRADLALTKAKMDGRGVLRFFEPFMEEQLGRRVMLAKELRIALEERQFHLAYQPKVYVASGRVSGFEALLRWNHPRRGSISPADFIPIAEESGLIIQIGEWVLREACREAATWENGLSVAVNFSPAQFRQADLVQTISGVLAATGLDPQRLEIEITESLFFESNQRSITILNEIKAMGVSIAIDDFGTGFSSLSTLQSFEFDTIKIDRSFINKINKSSKATSIVKAIVHLASNLDMNVVAEGVEIREQFDFLRKQGCPQIQGYFFGAAHPIEKYAHLVSNTLEVEVA